MHPIAMKKLHQLNTSLTCLSHASLYSSPRILSIGHLSLFNPVCYSRSYSVTYIITLVSSARIAQIYHIYKCKSTGSLALITCLLVVLGNLGRLFTVLVETADDYLFIISVVVAFALNFTIVVQFFIYWNNGKQKTQ